MDKSSDDPSNLEKGESSNGVESSISASKSEDTSKKSSKKSSKKGKKKGKKKEEHPEEIKEEVKKENNDEDEDMINMGMIKTEEEIKKEAEEEQKALDEEEKKENNDNESDKIIPQIEEDKKEDDSSKLEEEKKEEDNPKKKGKKKAKKGKKDKKEDPPKEEEKKEEDNSSSPKKSPEKKGKKSKNPTAEDAPKEEEKKEDESSKLEEEKKEEDNSSSPKKTPKKSPEKKGKKSKNPTAEDAPKEEEEKKEEDNENSKKTPKKPGKKGKKSKNPTAEEAPKEEENKIIDNVVIEGENQEEKKPKVSPKKTAKQPNSKTSEIDQDIEFLNNYINSTTSSMTEFRETIIKNKNNHYRKKLVKGYKDKYNEDLIESLIQKVPEEYKELIKVLFLPPIDYDVLKLNEAIKHEENESLIFDIILTRPSWILKKIEEAYKAKYETELTTHLEEHMTSKFKGFAKRFVTTIRKEEDDRVDKRQCEGRAGELNKEEGNWKNENSKFFKYLTVCNRKELSFIYKNYLKIYNKTVFETVMKEFEEDDSITINSIIMAIIIPPEHFARKLIPLFEVASIENKDLLVETIMTRDEVDLHLIKKYFKKISNLDLMETIKNENLGDLGDILLEVLAKNN